MKLVPAGYKMKPGFLSSKDLLTYLKESAEMSHGPYNRNQKKRPKASLRAMEQVKIPGRAPDLGA